MDAFQIIANVFKKDCMKRLKMLEEANFILNSSETINKALGLIFMHSSLYPESIDQLRSMQSEIQQLHNCIDATEVIFSSHGTATIPADLILHRKTCSMQERSLW